MKEIKDRFVRIFLYSCILAIVSLGLLTIIGSGGGGGGTASTPNPTPAPTCVGPVPCLTTDWGNTFREFEEPDGSPILTLSDGTVYAGAGFDDLDRILSLGGTVTDCNNSVIELAGIDVNGNFIIDDPTEFFTASGNVEICGSTLIVTNLVIDGVPENDITATYVGTFTASVHIDSEVPPEILFDVMDKMNFE